MFFCCPVCGRKLEESAGSLRCKKGHCFDRARSGYVNLLLANRMHAKLPGDNREMVAARSRFLEGGYYAPLQNALCEQVLAFLPQMQAPVLLDSGCGEGYYTAAVAHAVHQAAPGASVLGADISKAALSAAAKRTKEAAFAVASAFALPVPDDSVDILTSVFSPFCQSEFRRVLKAGGVFLEVIPSARHLFGLKAALYDRPYENKVKPYAIAGFAFLNKREVSGEITLTNPADIAALFQMTPYAYRTPAEAVKRLSALPSLRTEIAFEILAYRALPKAD